MAEGPYSRRLTVVATPAVTVAAAPQTLTSVPKSGYGENRGGGMMTGTGGDDGVNLFPKNHPRNSHPDPQKNFEPRHGKKHEAQGVTVSEYVGGQKKQSSFVPFRNLVRPFPHESSSRFASCTYSELGRTPGRTFRQTFPTFGQNILAEQDRHNGPNRNRYERTQQDRRTTAPTGWYDSRLNRTGTTTGPTDRWKTGPTVRETWKAAARGTRRAAATVRAPGSCSDCEGHLR